jgi:hypothetical protein
LVKSAVSLCLIFHHISSCEFTHHKQHPFTLQYLSLHVNKPLYQPTRIMQMITLIALCCPGLIFPADEQNARQLQLRNQFVGGWAVFFALENVNVIVVLVHYGFELKYHRGVMHVHRTSVISV